MKIKFYLLICLLLLINTSVFAEMSYVSSGGLKKSGGTITGTLTATGNSVFTQAVAIGTTTPATALHVIGTLTVSSGIVVAGSTMTVPDYVFDESYRLMSLDELQEYVEVNKHLSEFESARNTKQLNLVQDNMRLREAIEKLTLYLFDMKQEIADLKRK